MTNMREKSALILQNEERFVNALASQVLDKPALSIWMIFIPIIFIHYFYRVQKFVAGRKMFAENYMINRRRALDEALSVVETRKVPDIPSLANRPDEPEQTRQRHAEVLAVLVEHYTDLLRSEGKDFESLVRSAYKNRMNYLLFLNKLNQAEKKLNSALKPHLDPTVEAVNSIVSAMEQCSEKLRRQSAEVIFG